MSVLEERYESLSPSEFFYRNREIAGFSNPTRALYQTVRELVENSLDATELHKIPPDIKIIISIKEPPDLVSILVEDNGIGIPHEEVPFVFGRVFYGSKYVLRQSRGVFGLGIKMAVLYAQITTGKPIWIRTSTMNSKIIAEYRIKMDISRNMPIVISANFRKKRSKWHGTIVKLITKGNWTLARRRIEDYIRRTAMITPYADIYFKGPDVELIFKRNTRKMPTPPKVGKPHPYGIDLEMLRRLIEIHNRNITLRDFIMKCFEGVGEGIAHNFLEWARLNGDKKLKDLSTSEIENLLNKMKSYRGWRRPRALSLSPLGEDLLRKGIERILSPEYVVTVTRKTSSYSGNPFIVEVGLAWGGKIPMVRSPILYRFANKIPLLYDEGVDVARQVVDKIDWSLYRVKFPAPLAVIVHLCSTKVPFKGVGKEAIADVVEVEKEIENAIKEAARSLRKYLTLIERKRALIAKRITISKYIPEVARALAEVTGTSETKIAKKLSLILDRIMRTESKKRGDVDHE